MRLRVANLLPARLLGAVRFSARLLGATLFPARLLGAVRFSARLLGATLLLLLVSGGAQGAEEDPGVLLRRAARRDLPLSQRLALVQGVLERAQPAAGTAPAPASVLPVGPAVRTGLSLLATTPEVGAWLIHRGLEAGYLEAAPRRSALKRVEALRAAADPSRDATTRAIHAAAAFRLGNRSAALAADLTAVWPPPAVVLAALQADLGRVVLADGRAFVGTGDAPAARALLDTQLPLLALLDQATRDAGAPSRAALDALVAAGPAAVPLLLHEVRRATEAPAPGRLERATRAILALGILRDRRATPALIAALGASDGWIRTYAATALGDLGDPAAVVALARQCTLLGDPLRARDQWEYPGSDNTPIAEADWASSPYYVIDTSAANSLLRLGVAGAADWLITQQLDPRKKNYRVRVLQDATDALRRGVREIPIAAYNVDAGLPLREAGWLKLLAWWHLHRDDPKLLRHPLDETDARFQTAARGLANVFAGPSVREMMMAKAAIQLLGPRMTLALIAAIPTAKNAFHRAELAESLGLVRDPRAVEGLLGLARDPQLFVRKKAVKSLGTYVDGHPEALALELGMLSSKRAGLRVAAMEGLAHARPSADVRTAITTWMATDAKRKAAGRASWRTPDVEIALTVVRLVQEGDAHLAAVEAGLAHAQRAKRRIWWDLVRAALDLPEPLNDPVSDPDSATARHVSEATLREALRKRRDA